MKKGRNAKPAIEIRRLATCGGEKATSPFFIKKKELPHTRESKIKVAKPSVAALDFFSIVAKEYLFRRQR